MCSHAKIIASFLFLTAVCLTYAQTHSGLTCEDAIPLGSEYNGEVPAAGTYWYVGNTYDLPLKIHFAPSDGTSNIAPTVEVDFTCTPGKYDDPKLDSIINEATEWGYTMPLTFTCDLEVVDGRNEFSMSVGKSYRDILASLGMTENVTAYVKVTYAGGGGIGLAPDTAFANCMDRGALVDIGHTLAVAAEDDETYFIFPMTKWQNDSIRFIWKGKSEAKIYLSTICNFELDQFDDVNRIYKVYSAKQNDTINFTNAEIKRALDWPENNGGLYYMKVFCKSIGALSIEQIPMTPPKGDATVLSYNNRTTIRGNAKDYLYAIPFFFNKATQFTTPTKHVFKMYVGLTPDFTLENAIATYQYGMTENGHRLNLLEEEMQSLWAQALGNYLYIRFVCTETTSILPTVWNPSECIIKAAQIKKGEPVSIPARSTANYRLLYSEWIGGELSINWKSQIVACPFFLGDSCIYADESNPHVFYTGRIGKNQTVAYTSAEVDSWANYVDGDGYLYILFNPTGKGNITITTTAPEETDPPIVEPVIPHATVHVSCAEGDPHTLLVTVSEPQTLTVTADGTTVEQWEATPAEPHTINLSAGQYTLTGTKEEILLLVP